MVRVLLAESWYGGSHRAWVDGWIAHSRHDIDAVTLPDRFWRRRLRVGAAELAPLVDEWVAGHGTVDVLVATSMVDLAALVGLCRRSLRDAATVVYCHENQLVYPHPDRVSAPDVDAAARTLQSLLVADRIIVNSAHHLDELRAGGARALGEFGIDGGRVARRLIAALDAAVVVPVGVDLAWCRPDRVDDRGRSDASGDPVVMWSHRWDPDKAPDAVVRTLERLAADGVAFEVVLAGEDGWDGDARRAAACRRLGSRVVASGHLPAEQYRRWVRAADVAVSTARHEYFGVAMVEAMAARCVPVLPRRCSYPELVPSRFHDAALYADGDFGRHLRRVLADLGAARDAVVGLDEAMAPYDWSVVAPLLDATVEAAATHPGR